LFGTKVAEVFMHHTAYLKFVETVNIFH